MSSNDDNPEEVKKAQKKYRWSGYGGYPGAGEEGSFNTVNPALVQDYLKDCSKYSG